MIGNAIPQPERGQNGKRDTATGSQRPQCQNQREDAEAIGDRWAGQTSPL